MRFRNPDTGSLRGVRCVENVLYPPSDEEGWGSQTYYGTKPKVCVSKKGASESELTGWVCAEKRKKGLPNWL